MIDVSSGGVGLWTGVFFPKGCRLLLRLPGQEGLPEGGVLIRVQRVQMTDRRPTYYLGASFAGDPQGNAQVSAALRALAIAAPVKAEDAARA